MRSAVLVPLVAGALLAGGCGSQGTVSPTAETVEGTVAGPGEGNAAAGKTVFLKTANPACGSCHTFEPAGTKGTVGPDLDKLPELAKNANQGSLAEFTRTSISNPDQYVEKGFPPGVMPNYSDSLSSKQIDDLVAFLTQGAK